MPDLEKLVQRLIEHNVGFVIVGGYAAIAHGVTLITFDVDVCRMAMVFDPGGNTLCIHKRNAA